MKGRLADTGVHPDVVFEKQPQNGTHHDASQVFEEETEHVPTLVHITAVLRTTADWQEPWGLVVVMEPVGVSVWLGSLTARAHACAED